MLLPPSPESSASAKATIQAMRGKALICLVFGVALMVRGNAATDKRLDEYNVVWRSPSVSSAGSMPIGNGEVVANVWVEQKTGDLIVLFGRTDSLSEISRILKIGRIRISISPSPFLGRDFQQALVLRDGEIRFEGGGERVVLIVDSAADVIHVDARFGTPRAVVVRSEPWRVSPRQLPAAEMRSAWAVRDAPFPLVESADVFLDRRDSVLWYHRNETSVVPALWANQSITSLPGTHDPLLHRTFGARVTGSGLKSVDKWTLSTKSSTNQLAVVIATATKVTQSTAEWVRAVDAEAEQSQVSSARARTRRWWREYWSRSFVFVNEGSLVEPVPFNDFPLRIGFDSDGENRFQGEIGEWEVVADRVMSSEWMRDWKRSSTQADANGIRNSNRFTLIARIRRGSDAPGRIIDKISAGQADGFLFDVQPGGTLRLIVGTTTLTAPGSVSTSQWHTVAATVSDSGERALFVDGALVARREPPAGSPIARGYLLQRYVQACQGRGTFPIKFNGGYYTVEPTPMGIQADADFRNWGDCHWFQNVRHMYHPMLASGDVEMLEPFFNLYESALPLAESRARYYHGVSGAYFPETMTVYGTYAGGDYGWDRTGLEPKDVQCPWWDDAWNQGLELVDIMLDRWSYTRDESFLRERLLPMAESVLRYFDTRFARGSDGKLIISPTQVVETYWDGVTNDTPVVAGLISTTRRLTRLPAREVGVDRMAFFKRMESSCPSVPLETVNGSRKIAPASAYSPKTYNVENGELYAIWPFRIASLSEPNLLAEARAAYAYRKNRLDNGWGYDGNVAALLGDWQESKRILNVKVRNSHPSYRWPATWGPNFDWLPDQNHGGNLLNMTHLMLLQCDDLEAGGAIRLLPAWPPDWDVSFKLHAPGNTVVECTYRQGRIERLVVTPPARRRNVVPPPANGDGRLGTNK